MNADPETKPVHPVEDKEIFQLYERLYFHEIDVREKLNYRLQLPLALIITLLGVLGSFIQHFHHHQFSYFEIGFWLFFFISTAMLGRAIFFFSKAWINNSYFLLPTSREIDKYRKSFVDLFKDHHQGQVLTRNGFSQYLIHSYIENASINADCNVRRSGYLNRTGMTLIITAILLLITVFFFYFGEINKPASGQSQHNCAHSIQPTGARHG
ncbi:MAG: hypothetical protein H7834_15170 [Magnetococcus sp. YQC-9]